MLIFLFKKNNENKIYNTYEKLCNNPKTEKSATKTKTKTKLNKKLSTKSKVYSFGGFKINFIKLLTPIEASKIIVDNCDQKSKMYKGM